MSWYQPDNRVLHEVFVLMEVIEDLRPDYEVPAVLPLTQVPYRGHLRNEPVLTDIHHVMR